MSEVKGVLDNFRFETFVDVHSNIFAEYLSPVIAKLPKENPEYHSIEERIEERYKEYPKVIEALDTETPSDLSEQECKALIEVFGASEQAQRYAAGSNLFQRVL